VRKSDHRRAAEWGIREDPRGFWPCHAPPHHDGGRGIAIVRCAFIKADGQRCKGIAMGDAQWCYSHDPARAEERRRNASRGGKHGGRGRNNHELTAIKAQLEDLTRDVLSGDLETGRAAVANQLTNTRLRAIEQERKNKETQDLEARIEALERAQERGGPRWRGA
jgi:hypothetical protein